MFSKKSLLRVIQSRNFKHGILYTIFSFINSGISFILLLILANYLTPYDYGQLNLFTTFVTLLNILITLCTISYVSVSFFQKNRDVLKQIIVIVLATTTLMLIALSLLLIFFPSFIEKSIGVPLRYLWLGLLICYFQVFNTLNLDIWRLEEKPINYGLYSVSFAICNFILTFWLIVGLRLGWVGRVYAWWLLGCLYFLISLIFLVKRKYLIISNPSFDLIKETLVYALPLLPHTVSFWLKQGLDRYIINYFYGQEIVGYFSFATNLAAIIGLIGNAFNATNSVYIFKKLTDGYYKVKDSLDKQTKIMTIIFFLGSACVIVFAWLLISIGIPKYLNSLQYIFPLCIGGFFQCTYLLWVNYLFFYKKTKQLMYITLTTAIVQALMSIWLTRYSPLVTAYISMTITAITFFLVFGQAKKVLSRQFYNKD